ncbi:hypothetical protein [Paracoccus sp. pheM1]|uniref:hypothetical protein n=1 Tax=Paracoccus sp. pheM1 TaxID=2831675 RepID=UPI001BDB862B|nr:hypothetical protein [Paracoccus sp. pheM1]MBT0781228.1 hypothetical protein [Paracoccus sp. pheM1]
MIIRGDLAKATAIAVSLPGISMANEVAPGVFKIASDGSEKIDCLGECGTVSNTFCRSIMVLAKPPRHRSMGEMHS